MNDKRITTPPCTTNDIRELLSRLFDQYQANPSDEALFQQMIDEFHPALDLVDQIKQFHAWCLDQHPKKITNCRFRLRSWLKNADSYKKSRITYPSSAYTRS